MKSPESQKEGANMVHEAAQVLKYEVGAKVAEKIIEKVAEKGADALPAISNGWQTVKALFGVFGFHGVGILANHFYETFMHAVRHGAANMWPQPPPRPRGPALRHAPRAIDNLIRNPQQIRDFRNMALLAMMPRVGRSSGNWRLFNVQNPFKRQVKIWKAMPAKKKRTNPYRFILNGALATAGSTLATVALKKYLNTRYAQNHPPETFAI